MGKHMTMNEYQIKALVTAASVGDDFRDLLHWVLGVSGEAGEITEKFKKIIRDKGGSVSAEDKTEIVKEMGDVLWYLAVLAKQLDVDFETVAKENIKKLRSRQMRNKIGGSGDNR